MSIFDTTGLPPRTIAQLDYALSRCDFPWHLLLPKMRETKGIDKIDVRIGDTGAFAATASMGWINLNPQALGSLEDGTFGIVHELGHIVDYFYLTDEMRSSILDIMHEEVGDDGRCGNAWNGNRSEDTTVRTKYLEMPSEAWAEIFACGAFSDYKSTGFRYTHFVKDPARQARIRQVVLPGAKPFVSEMSTVTKLFRLKVTYKQGGSIAKGFLTPWTSLRRLSKYIELDSETIVGLRDHTGKAGHKVEVIGKTT